MAESHTFIQASEILSMISSHTLEVNKGATKELEKLRSTIEAIQSVLPDAEKHQDSPDVNSWIDNVSATLNQVHSLIHKNPAKKKSKLKEVQSFFSSKLTIPLVPGDSFSKEVKAIRKRLLDISQAVHSFKFELVKCHFERPTGETHGFVDPRDIVGREDDENSILELLFDESCVEESCPIIAIASIEGMGKTKLAEKIFNHERVQAKFENRWWTHISFLGPEKEVLGKIFQSISGEAYEHHNISELRSETSKWLSRSGNNLLVLDDVWDNNLVIWSNIMAFIVSASSKGSKIIVTTRFLSVPRFLQKGKCRVYELNCLSEDKSWELFRKMMAIPGKENDPKLNTLGWEIVKKCANVPSAVKIMATVFRKITTMEDWEKIVKDDKLWSDRFIWSLKSLSYDPLPSKKMKRCFAYCSLFPKDHIIFKEKLIYLWIAQNFVKLENHETLEAAGHAYFMELFRRGFFQEVKVDDHGNIISCKMHDVFCDLAQHVKVKSIMLTQGENQFPEKIRHVSFGYEIHTTPNVPSSVLDQANRLLSLLIMVGKSCSSLFLDKHVMMFTFLWALDLHALNIEKVSSSIGELIHLRYLNLSENTFPTLPNSITMLVKLLALDISCCRYLEALPIDFRKLINLRHLDMRFCDKLHHMPPGFGELTSLVHLSDFKVSKGRVGGDIKNSKSGLDALDGLDLKGKLTITFDYRGVWLRDDTTLKYNHIPKALEQLTISDYPIPSWWKEIAGNDVVMSKLQHLVLIRCKLVKHLPPFHGLHVLRILQLYHLQELQYIVIDNKVELFRRLEKLELVDLPKLKGWSKEENYVEPPPFDHLSHLEIKYCHQLDSMPPFPHLQRLWLEETKEELVHQMVSTSSTLQGITINWCIELKNFPGKDLTKLCKLDIRNCTSLERLQLPSVNGVEEITISNCPDLKLWYYKEEEKRGVDWPSFTKLGLISLDEMPKDEKFPNCLQQLVALGKLQIKEWLFIAWLNNLLCYANQHPKTVYLGVQ